MTPQRRRHEERERLDMLVRLVGGFRCPNHNRQLNYSG
jgi:hypothetical protein